LLLGLVKEGFGVAAQVLAEMGVNLPGVRAQVQKVAPPNSHQSTIGTLPLKHDAHTTLANAFEEAKKLNHPQVGTAHILLGIISSMAPPVPQLLSALNLYPDKLKQRVHAGLRHPNYDEIEGFASTAYTQSLPNSLLLSPRPKKTYAQAVLRDVLWSLPTALAVGLVTQSDAAFAITFAIVSVSYAFRARQFIA
jgi:ATP-dependent Clp protease ATP-binding subunit ClpA